jgi:hypothetical protein
VNSPLRLWCVISTIAASHRTIIARVNESHRAYARTEAAGAISRQVLDSPLIGSDSPWYAPESELSLELSEVIRSTTFLGTACR